MSLKHNVAIDFSNRFPISSIGSKKTKVIQTVVLDDDANDLSPLMRILGNKSYFLNATTEYIGSIKSIQIREDDTVIDVLEVNGVNALATFGLTGRTLFAGEYITNGITGFTKVRTSAKTLKLNI